MALSAGSSHLGLLFIIASAIFFQSPGCLDIALFLPVSTHTSGVGAAGGAICCTATEIYEYTFDGVECGVYGQAVEDLGAIGDCRGKESFIPGFPYFGITAVEVTAPGGASWEWEVSVPPSAAVCSAGMVVVSAPSAAV
ncbi:hypothetical protein B484DRAFT_460625 [Ochromonadaceae sp. CCMP2298]|nr:hypothetical protein B484DRAFT_460625 [Ochromonadaceae sp. CCMP2298]